ncbi:hypothetical protein F503_05904 [Ophiostoma piceae UAMH 11346]|uniref:DUF8004 domain-containing protein n=1 Tax=Ophiostoma piceae (strain UAMH 11346) TaxID=1262450 RepID=S3CBC8_OPHP1|nr:hypothetical protein F503_05904 [Ophiostoma piceae UAMH 11346]
MEPPQESKDFALYNGVSNRSRGWKSRKPGESTEPQTARHTGIKRWDGNAKTSTAWDGLRRDPELWFRNGNCFVHLYARGQSRRGPAFKLPFSTLLAAQCHPMVECFIARDMPTLSNVSDMHDNTMLQPMPTPPPLATLDYWSRAHLLGRVDLYIPPPLEADKDQVYSYYLAIRNLFAWIFRRPVVGEHLGSALAGLFSAMREFRQANVDNAQDLMCYLEDEGYLVVSGQPEYALALLHLSETMHMRDLYITSFAHCVGMYNELFMGTEHQLIRRARLDMDLRLGSAGSMLRNFLEDELSETHLGLPAQSRTHLNRFRAFIQGYYTTRLGFYPPISIDARSTIFEPQVYRLMTEDFQTLYEYLVDTNFLAGSTESPLSQGGFCVLQNIKDFDARHKYAPQKHPLPLLPDTVVQPQITTSTNAATNTDTASNGFLGVPMPKRSLSTRRMSWFGSKKMDKLLQSRSEKLMPDTRLVANASLLKATNKLLPDTTRSEFINAYRQFEEDSVFKPYKADRMEKISLVEARKVRWILVYAIHQTLQNCFIPPPLQITNAATVRYHMSISPKHIPEWKGSEAGIQESSASTFSSPPVSPTSASLPPLRTLTNSFTFPATENLMLEPLTPTSRHKMMINALNDPTPPPARCMSMTALPDGHHPSTILMMPDRGRTASPIFDIRPDIDYLGLANRAEPTSLDGEVEVVMLPRSRSLTRTLSQKAAFRRSLSLFRGNSSNNTYTQSQEPLSPTRPSKGKQNDNGFDIKTEPSSLQSSFRSKRNSLLMRPSSQSKTEEKEKTHERKNSPYHEIVVHGYGNGTNPVQLTVSTDVADELGQESKEATEEGASPSTPLDDSATTPSTTRSLSTSSTTSNTSAATADTALTALTEASHISSIACPGVTRIDSVTDVAATPGLSRSSSMYSSTPGSSMAVSRANSFVAMEAPAIPPRGGQPQDVAQKQALPLPASISRSSSVYSTTSMMDDVLAAGGVRPTTTSMSSPSLGSSRRTPPPPPLPVRSSARHRRFSVYGGGDEYARLNHNLDALNSLGAAVPQCSNTAARFTSMISGSKRQDPQAPNVLHKQPPPQTQTQRRSSLHSATGSSHRPQSLYVGSGAQGGQRFDMVQEALEAVRETMEQHQMGPSAPVSRTPSFVGAAALRSVNEDDELTMGSPSAGERRRSKTLTQSRGSRQRHSSYIGPRDDSNIYSNNDDEDFYMDCTRRGQAQSEHPEWDKFAGLGGHTAV